MRHDKPVRSLIGLGSNLGDRLATLQSALGMLQAHPSIHQVSSSHVYQNSAIGGPEGQSAFFNAAASLETELGAEELLDVLHEIERKCGRNRNERWAARTLDLDLLLHGLEKIDRDSPKKISVPHPWMAVRPFVLRPALDVAPGMRHPHFETTIQELWQLISRPTTVVAIVRHQESNAADAVVRAASKACSTETFEIDNPSCRDLDISKCAERISQQADSLQSAMGNVDSTQRCIILDGWWEQALLERPELAKDPELVALYREISQSVPVPNVIVELVSNEQSVLSNLKPVLPNLRTRCPKLQLLGDKERLTHDLTALLRGLVNNQLKKIEDV